MDNIKDILKKVIGNIEHQKSSAADVCYEAWQNSISEEENKHARYVGVKQDALLVNVDSPAWLYQLNTRKSEILKNIQLSCPEIKRVNLKMGKV